MDKENNEVFSSQETLEVSKEKKQPSRLHGFLVIFFATLVTMIVTFLVVIVSNINLANTVKTAKESANESSDKYQDIRMTFVDGKITKEYLSEEEIKAENERIAKLEAEKKTEEEAKKKAEEEKKKAEEAKKKQQSQKKSSSSNASTYKVPSGAKIVYLTFDDGPGPYTSRLLDVLKKYNVKATFFVTCNRAQYRNVIARAYKEGHSIGAHSCSHDYAKVYKNDSAFFSELQGVQNVIKSATGSETRLFRFPGGSSNTVSKKYNKGIVSRVAKELGKRGYAYFDWNVSSGDAGGANNANAVYNNVVRNLKGNYSVVLQHDIKSFSVDAVERIIQYGLKNGFTFKALDTSSPTAHHRISN
jgi:peptidoglycan/xylan/chitin deacetylase (PgdA/CDA1 family)